MNQPRYNYFRGLILLIEVWLSLVERYVRDVEAECSNHFTSTTENRMNPPFKAVSCGFFFTVAYLTAFFGFILNDASQNIE